MAHKILPWLMLLLTQLLLLTVEIDAKVPAVIVFGDSSVDTGNNNKIQTVLKSNFKPYGRDFEGGKATGRFCNGRVPGDFISEAFGCRPLVPAYLDPSYSINDFATGVCFASAGTGYDNATSEVLSVIPLWKELEYYKEYQKKLKASMGDEKANEIIHEGLYLMSLGTNDFLENYYSTFSSRSSKYTVEQYEDFLAGIAGNFITELYGLGARKISLGGLVPMGCLPLERTRNLFTGSGCNEDHNKVARDFNVKLSVLTAKLNKELPGIKLVLSNPYDIFLDIVQKPSQYGLQNQLKNRLN
ncbi:Lipase [Macleaya cordata]|uniref:Lipase n=1 Tax=Macleaya cordata TaxID=56857 RepID=A0A200QS34_MACCD|nr:Lipase [Macleaya cordata]